MKNNQSYRDKLSELGINKLETGRSTCPECSQNRTNKSDKCLQITFDSDAVKYHCHHCGFSGVISYNNNQKDNFVPVKKAYKKPTQLKEITNKDKLYEYFKGRGINQNTVNDFELSVENNNIIFPYYRNGELVNIKTRGLLEKKFTQFKDGMASLFGMDTIPTNEKTIVFTEGEIDAMSLYQCGYYAVSVNQGGNDTNLDCVSNCFEFVNSFDTIVIAGDNDEVGQILINNLKDRFQNKIVKIVDWSVYCNGNIKDANDALKQKDGEFIIKDAMLLAKEVEIGGIETFTDHKQDLIEWYRGKRDINYSTGWANVDKIFKIQKERLMIVSGVSGKGKSLFVDNLLFNLTKQYKWKHLMATFETSFRSHICTLSQMIVKKSCLENSTERMSEDEFIKCIDTTSNYFFRYDIKRQWNITEILEKAELCITKYKYDTLVIDPYNRLKPEKYDREDKFIESILGRLLAFAKKNNVLVIFIAHPTKMPDKNVAPTLQNVSGGNAWHSMSDYGIIVDRLRNEDTGQLYTQSKIMVEKVKDETIGNPVGGNAYLDYNYGSYSLVEATKEIEPDKK